MGPYTNETVAILYHEERLREAERWRRARACVSRQPGDRSEGRRPWARLSRRLRSMRWPTRASRAHLHT